MPRRRPRLAAVLLLAAVLAAAAGVGGCEKRIHEANATPATIETLGEYESLT